MATTTGTPSYLQDSNGNNLLAASDWGIVQNKPTNLATTDELGALGAWKTDGITYKNGAYDWDHVNNGKNCAYRIADFGSFKIVEIRLEFSCSNTIGTSISQGQGETELIDLPAIVKPDSDMEYWETDANTVFHFNGQQLFVNALSGTISANSLFSFHDVYFTTL